VSATDLPTIVLPTGETVPALGQGTWHYAEDPARRPGEIAALQHGVDLGMTVVDTAEMYADGGAEQLVGEALGHRRDEIFLVDKVLPWDASRAGTVGAAERALRRLGTDRIDLYLLHWPGGHPIADTVAAFGELRDAGKIRYWGVSNLDIDDLAELAALGELPATDQILYNLTRRGPEWDVLPWLRRRGVPVTAYSPIEQGRLLGHPAVTAVAAAHDATPAQVALAWVLRAGDVLAIPKATGIAHVEENRAAAGLRLTDDDLAALDEAFPPPSRAEPLQML
jgi:diketogulonate reductase-like aldo/keto reductase